MPGSASAPTDISTHEGTLVIITRTPKSRIRTKTTKRHGTQCLIRGFEMVFPVLEHGAQPFVGTGFATADPPHAETMKLLASQRAPFYALVSHRNYREAHISQFLSAADGQALIRRTRQIHEDAAWDAAAPRPIAQEGLAQ